MSDFWRNKSRWLVLLAIPVLAVALHAPILRVVAAFLIVEDPLRQAAAIVALGGQTPFREIEAAKIFHGGFATRVIIVREAASAESAALQRLGIAKPPTWELARAVLVQQGVPPNAIVMATDEALGTLEELQAVWKEIQHGARSTEQSSLPVFQLSSNQQHLPVILVTSKYHTRRTRLTWDHVTAGRSQAIVRAAAGDPFDPQRWWHTRRYALSVVREYLGLANLYTGFAVGAGNN